MMPIRRPLTLTVTTRWKPVTGTCVSNPNAGVEAHQFDDFVAQVGEQLAADLLDLRGSQAADFLHASQRHSKHPCAVAQEERLGDHQGEGNFQREAAAGSLFGVNRDLAIQGSQIGADDIESHAPSGEFGTAGGCGEAWLEQELE